MHAHTYIRFNAHKHARKYPSSPHQLSTLFPLQGGAAAAHCVEAGEEMDDPQGWVSCELCSKWRCVDLGKIHL